MQGLPRRIQRIYGALQIPKIRSRSRLQILHRPLRQMPEAQQLGPQAPGLHLETKSLKQGQRTSKIVNDGYNS